MKKIKKKKNIKEPKALIKALCAIHCCFKNGGISITARFGQEVNNNNTCMNV